MNTLPNELFCQVAGFLGVVDLLSWRGVNRQWRELVHYFLQEREILTSEAALIWAWSWHHRLYLRIWARSLDLPPLYKLEIMGREQRWHGEGLQVEHFMARNIHLLSWPTIKESAHFAHCTVAGEWSYRVPHMTFHYCEIQKARNESCQSLEIIENDDQEVFLRGFPRVSYYVHRVAEINFLRCESVTVNTPPLGPAVTLNVENTTTLILEKGQVFLHTLTPLENLQVGEHFTLFPHHPHIDCRHLIAAKKIYWDYFLLSHILTLQVDPSLLPAKTGIFPNVHTLRDLQGRPFVHPSCPAALLEN